MESQLIIKEPQKPFSSRVIVSFLYAIYLTYIVYLMKVDVLFKHPRAIEICIFLIILLYILISTTFPVIASHFIRFDFKELKIRHEYQFGYFTYKEGWQNLNNLNYISVFYQDLEYWVSMWYEDHKVLNLFSSIDYKDAIKKSVMISEKLEIDLLDATIEDELNHWIDKNHYIQNEEIKYLD